MSHDILPHHQLKWLTVKTVCIKIKLETKFYYSFILNMLLLFTTHPHMFYLLVKTHTLFVCTLLFSCKFTQAPRSLGGGPRVVVSTAAFHARVRGSVNGLGGLKETKMFLPHPRVKVSIVGSQYRGSVLGLRPPGLEFRIL